MPAPKSAWCSGSKREEKPWGEIRTWTALPGIHGRLIVIHKDHRTSLKYHKLKDEVFYVVDGIVKVTYGNEKTLQKPDKHPYENKILKAGDTLVVQSECPYRIYAVEDATLLEVGNREQDQPIILEDDYGRSA